jgi:hypothetical protein
MNSNRYESSRRRTLLGALALWLGSALPAWAQVAAKAAKATSSDVKRFIEVSALATGRRNLDPKLAATLFAALAARDRAFATRVAALQGFAQSHNITDVETLHAALIDNPLQADLMRIIATWYTGAVGDGPEAKEVTYIQALMYEASADGSHNPGLCASATKSWGTLERPPVDVLPKSLGVGR